MTYSLRFKIPFVLAFYIHSIFSMNLHVHACLDIQSKNYAFRLLKHIVI
jgi:hypothetical protein